MNIKDLLSRDDLYCVKYLGDTLWIQYANRQDKEVACRQLSKEDVDYLIITLKKYKKAIDMIYYFLIKRHDTKFSEETIKSIIINEIYYKESENK